MIIKIHSNKTIDSDIGNKHTSNINKRVKRNIKKVFT